MYWINIKKCEITYLGKKKKKDTVSDLSISKLVPWNLTLEFPFQIIICVISIYRFHYFPSEQQWDLNQMSPSRCQPFLEPKAKKHHLGTGSVHLGISRPQPKHLSLCLDGLGGRKHLSNFLWLGQPTGLCEALVRVEFAGNSSYHLIW